MRTCAEGLAVSNKLFAPEEIGRQKLGSFYADHRILSRATFVPLYTVLGAIKPLLMPLIGLVGTLVFPILAAVRAPHGEAKKYLQAWAFSLLAVVGFVAFMSISAYYLPLNVSAGLFIGGVVLSITIHVSRAVKAPTAINA